MGVTINIPEEAQQCEVVRVLLAEGLGASVEIHGEHLPSAIVGSLVSADNECVSVRMTSGPVVVIKTDRIVAVVVEPTESQCESKGAS